MVIMNELSVKTGKEALFLNRNDNQKNKMNPVKETIVEYPITLKYGILIVPRRSKGEI